MLLIVDRRYKKWPRDLENITSEKHEVHYFITCGLCLVEIKNIISYACYKQHWTAKTDTLAIHVKLE